MMRSTIDLLGMYTYDHSILDGLVYPEGIDGDILKDNLLMESAEQELIYSDVDFLKSAISRWSNKQLHVWNELYDTTQYEYNPIWNKDGTVSETITRNLAGSENWTDTHNRENKETRNLAGTNDATTTEEVFGFNSSSAAPANKVTVDQDTSDTGTDTINMTGTISRTAGNTDTGTITTERTEQGNIGVTSTQSMIKEQREVVQLNMIDVIIKDFIDRFCLKVY